MEWKYFVTYGKITFSCLFNKICITSVMTDFFEIFDKFKNMYFSKILGFSHTIVLMVTTL